MQSTCIYLAVCADFATRGFSASSSSVGSSSNTLGGSTAHTRRDVLARLGKLGRLERFTTTTDVRASMNATVGQHDDEENGMDRCVAHRDRLYYDRAAQSQGFQFPILNKREAVTKFDRLTLLVVEAASVTALLAVPVLVVGSSSRW